MMFEKKQLAGTEDKEPLAPGPRPPNQPEQNGSIKSVPVCRDTYPECELIRIPSSILPSHRAGNRDVGAVLRRTDLAELPGQIPGLYPAGTQRQPLNASLRPLVWTGPCATAVAHEWTSHRRWAA